MYHVTCFHTKLLLTTIWAVHCCLNLIIVISTKNFNSWSRLYKEFEIIDRRVRIKFLYITEKILSRIKKRVHFRLIGEGHYQCLRVDNARVNCYHFQGSIRLHNYQLHRINKMTWPLLTDENPLCLSCSRCIILLS